MALFNKFSEALQRPQAKSLHQPAAVHRPPERLLADQLDEELVHSALHLLGTLRAAFGGRELQTYLE